MTILEAVRRMNASPSAWLAAALLLVPAVGFILVVAMSMNFN